MFAKAYETASAFTKPVITSVRFSDNAVHSSLGAFVILNQEGWIMTAAHILKSFADYQNHKKENKELKKNVEKQRRIINHSFWWGQDNLKIDKIHVNFEIDLAIGRLNSLPENTPKDYPKIINPHHMKPGTSLCKLGYPFYHIKTSWNSKTLSFEIDPKLFPIPRYPLEGMYTRNVLMGKSKDPKYQRKFIETSTPGLRGQSGGPIFDADGRIWAIQSQTMSLPLGFSPKLKKGNKETTEHQFINVGLGVHAEILIQFLKEYGVKFEMTQV